MNRIVLRPLSLNNLRLLFVDKKVKKVVGFIDPAPYDPDASLRSIDDLNKLE